MHLRPADQLPVYALLDRSYRYAVVELPMDVSAVQKALWQAIPSPSDATLLSIKELTDGSLHTLFLLTMADGTRLVLKIAPPQNTRLLRHEQNALRSEAEALQVLKAQGQIPVPRLLKYDSQGGDLGAPYILMEYIPGMPLKELHPCLDANDKRSIDRQLGRFFYYISKTPQLLSSFGPLVRVTAGAGFPTWGEAFLSLIEAVLRDAEDLVVLLPYEQIRKEVDRLLPVLNDVREAKLVTMNEGYSNILLDSRTNRVTAILDYGRVLLGDPMLSEIFATASPAFIEGYGSCPSSVGRERTRQLLSSNNILPAQPTHGAGVRGSEATFRSIILTHNGDILVLPLRLLTALLTILPPEPQTYKFLTLHDPLRYRSPSIYFATANVAPRLIDTNARTSHLRIAVVSLLDDASRTATPLIYYHSVLSGYGPGEKFYFVRALHLFLSIYMGSKESPVPVPASLEGR